MRNRLVAAVEAERRDLVEVTRGRADQDGRCVRVSGVAAGRNSLTHPNGGRLKREYASQASNGPALRLVIYTAAWLSAGPGIEAPAGIPLPGNPVGRIAVFVRLLISRRTKA